MESSMSCRRALDGNGETFTYYFEGFDLRADRRDRRRRHHLAARAPGWREELGLSLLLAARRHFHAVSLYEPRILRGSEGVARLAAAEIGRASCRERG